jgi:alpha-mannosidase
VALNLLRSPAYASFNLKPYIDGHVDRFIPRQDQGEHEFRFRMMFTHRFDEKVVQKEAAVFNMPPAWQVFHPGNEGATPSYGEGVTCASPEVLTTAVKKAENKNALIVRVQEVGGKTQETHVTVEGVADPIPLQLNAYELKTLMITRKKNGSASHRYVNLVEGI